MNKIYVKLTKNGTETTRSIEASSTGTVQVGRAVTAGDMYQWALDMETQNLNMLEGT